MTADGFQAPGFKTTCRRFCPKVVPPVKATRLDQRPCDTAQCARARATPLLSYWIGVILPDSSRTTTRGPRFFLAGLFRRRPLACPRAKRARASSRTYRRGDRRRASSTGTTLVTSPVGPIPIKSSGPVVARRLRAPEIESRNRPASSAIFLRPGSRRAFLRTLADSMGSCPPGGWDPSPGAGPLKASA